MQPNALRAAQEWIDRAEIDLRLAQRALLAPPLPSGAAYHAQQVGEKALKGFLTASGATFRPTHDVEELQRQCAAIDASFSPFLSGARTLTPYATEFRYPGGQLEPAETDAPGGPDRRDALAARPEAAQPSAPTIAR